MYVTMMISAFWHGFYGGYYITFGFGAWAQSIGKSLRRTLRPIFENFDTGKTPFWYNTCGRILTALMLNFLTVSFMVISIPNTLFIWRKASYIGIIIMVGTQITLKLVSSTAWHRELNAKVQDGRDGEEGHEEEEEGISRNMRVVMLVFRLGSIVSQLFNTFSCFLKTFIKYTQYKILYKVYAYILIYYERLVF